jgi:hypothetical protein
VRRLPRGANHIGVAAQDGVIYAFGGEAYATMITPCHGMGVAVIGDAIHVAGGGPMNGSMFQTSVHEVWAA